MGKYDYEEYVVEYEANNDDQDQVKGQGQEIPDYPCASCQQLVKENNCVRIMNNDTRTVTFVCWVCVSNILVNYRRMEARVQLLEKRVATLIEQRGVDDVIN